VKTVITSFSF